MRIQTIYALLWIFLINAVLLAQEIALSDSVVDFGRVSAYRQYIKTLTVFNRQDKPLHIRKACFAGPQFSTDLQASAIAAGDSQKFHIYFEAVQNVDYNDFLRIESDGGDRSLIVKTQASAIYDDSYYDATQNLWGDALKSALHNIIKNHTQYSYSNVWEILQQTDEDPNNKNNVLLLYSGWSYAKSNHGGNTDQWNREHVWAKYHGGFGTSPPAGTDVHHLRPTDVTVNSKRGNLDFDEGGSLYVDPDGATGCRYDDDSWEPRDAVKGDVARMMYYMVVRYEGEEGYDLELVDFTPSTSNGAPVFGKLSTLYRWHWSDSVDDWERRRNNLIYSNWQHNRNPFIDHPEFADRLPSISGRPLKSGPEIAITPQMIDMGEVGLNTSTHFSLAIINTGNETLHVTQAHTSGRDFTVEQTSMIIAPENYDYLTVQFISGEEEGVFKDTLQIINDDSDEGKMQIPLTVIVSKTVGIKTNLFLPLRVILRQNYPNPFNSDTRIAYRLGESSEVYLTVYNALGQKVMTQKWGRQSKGEHSYIFKGQGLPSGLYYYSLKTAGRTQIRKMILLR